MIRHVVVVSRELPLVEPEEVREILGSSLTLPTPFHTRLQKLNLQTKTSRLPLVQHCTASFALQPHFVTQTVCVRLILWAKLERRYLLAWDFFQSYAT